MVGFNRRFAPLLGQLKSKFGQPDCGSVARYLVNAGRLDSDSWYRNEELAGSRFVGEGGHFIDTLSWWAGSTPTEVYAVPGPEHDDLQATLRFGNGSTGTIAYVTGGNVRFPKETLDAAAGGRTARLDNFRQAAVWAGRSRTTMRSRGGQDKGQRRQLEQFVAACQCRLADAHLTRVPGGHHSRDDRGRAEPGERQAGASMSTGQGSGLGWYARRLARMSPAEVLWRGRDEVVKAAWSGKQVHRDLIGAGTSAAAAERRFISVLPPDAAALVPKAARAAVLAAADELLRGHWEVLGAARSDMVAPDWFLDPLSGRRAPADRYAFRINHRSEEQTGNIKQIWEVSRLQHLTLLATAWFLSHDEAYARRAAEQLRSWWRDNPFLSGVHWTSGIEVGIRLISMTWIRRLMDDWPKVADLFEHDELAVRQIRWHQEFLAGFRSRGSSANNHVIAEAAGQLVGELCVPVVRRK